MEQFNFISILGADARMPTPDTDVAKATKDLNRKSLKMHGRHAVSWLIRAAVIAAFYLLGRYGLEGTIGGALSVTAAFAGAYLLWYIPQGHLKIQTIRQARLYWIRNDAGNNSFCSDDPIVVTMPAQEPVGADWYGKQAAS
jgi:hypothetical protein